MKYCSDYVACNSSSCFYEDGKMPSIAFGMPRHGMTMHTDAVEHNVITEHIMPDDRSGMKKAH